ncbi:MAG: hypothetical protein BGP12_06920 [Rhodospirillales bacterium 70-18]|nr:MAG: hypothetical protein BGP12_06920 [Rhodospirillales bacterium 70-18]
MDDFQLQWTIEGATELSRTLIGLESKLKDYRTPFRQSADMLVRQFSKDVFATQGAVIGEKWKRLSPYTVAQKARLGFSGGPLVRTGRMQRSFESIVSTDQAVVRNTAPYFPYHQSGEPRTRLPRRVMMKLSQSTKAEIVRFFQDYIRSAAGKASFEP